jgi:predicted O-methyltransferase YrrM
MLLIANKPLRVAFALIETANLLALKLWMKNPGAARIFPGRVFRTYMSLVKQDRWLSQTIDELLPDLKDGTIVLEHMEGGGIFTPIDELAYMALITKYIAPKRIFEIGTFRGRTALNFARNSPPDCIVYTLDLPPDGRVDARLATNAADERIISKSETGIDYRGKPDAEKIRQLFGDSTKFDFTPYIESMDLVLVDGAHHYDAVVSDTRNALRMVRPGGWILWHDFANYGDYNDVTRAVLERLPGDQVIQIDQTQLAAYRRPNNNVANAHQTSRGWPVEDVTS